MELTSKQRAFLRGLANPLETILQVGKGEITPAMVAQVGDALQARELVKLRVLPNSPYTAREAAAALAGACQPGALMNKYVVVVDEDIDPTKLDEVVWAISTRSDPARDIDILRECLSSAAEPTLRPEDRAAGRVWTGRALIRAVRPYDMVKGGAFSPVAETPPELLRAVQEKYSALLGPSENT